MKHSILGLTATCVIVGSSQASVLVDNFESYGSIGSDMNGQGSWTVTNGSPANPSEGPVVIVDAGITGAKSATIGGVQPTSNALTNLYNNSFNVPLVSLTAQPTFFLVDTAYLESAGGSSRNNFSFVLGSTAGNILTINFAPDGAANYIGNWSVFGGDSGAFTINQATPTQLRLNTYASGLDVGYSFYTGSNVGTYSTVGDAFLGSGTLGAALPTDALNSFEVNWFSASGGGVFNPLGSSNSFTIDNINVVPEPASAMLGLLGASFVFLRRRRA